MNLMVLKCSLNNICNTVMSGQGPSSSGGPLWNARKKPGKGVGLTSQSKHILTSVRSYFEEEKQTGKSLMKNRQTTGQNSNSNFQGYN